jgi:hypothetical protein
MAKISRPMKLIALRIDEEEKARLEQLAEARDVTLSRALREGAALYLSERQAKSHVAKGGDATFLGIRRDAQGRNINKSSRPTKGELTRIRSLRAALQETALDGIGIAWAKSADPSVVIAAVGQWLSLVGRLYVANESEIGWQWFLRDYCAPYDQPDAAKRLCAQIRGSLLSAPELNVGAVLDTLEHGIARLLSDCEEQELVRRSVLPAWSVMRGELLSHED